MRRMPAGPLMPRDGVKGDWALEETHGPAFFL